ncbi:LysE family translocator [Formicincola oecophyllae]|nr:LysE family translocator [Formicincola oecophyllae]
MIPVMSPGLDTVMVIRLATMESWRSALGAVLGICTTMALWGLAAALGLSALLAASPKALLVVKWVGALYLAWLGIKLVLHPRSTMGLQGDATAAGRTMPKAHGGFMASYVVGFVTNLLNPQVGLFIMMFLPQFIPSGAPVTLATLALTAVLVFNAGWWNVLLIGASVPLVRMLTRPAFVRCFDRLMGALFLFFAVKLSLS